MKFETKNYSRLWEFVTRQFRNSFVFSLQKFFRVLTQMTSYACWSFLLTFFTPTESIFSLQKNKNHVFETRKFKILPPFLNQVEDLQNMRSFKGGTQLGNSEVWNVQWSTSICCVSKSGDGQTCLIHSQSFLVDRFLSHHSF